MRPAAHTTRALVTGVALTVLLLPSVVAAEVGAEGPGLTGPPAVPAVTLGIGGSTSVVLMEATTGQVLVARDAERRRPIASAMKLVTALTVVEQRPPGSAILTDAGAVGIEGSSFGIRAGELRSTDELLAGLLLRSGNDAAVALAIDIAGSEEAFTVLMAERLALLGIEARPGSASGLERSDALSAHELAVVAGEALRVPRIRDLVDDPTFILSDGRSIENRNAFLGDLDGATGLKTGFTSAAGFTLAASAERDGRELIAVVLGAGDDAERRAVAVELLEYGFSATQPRDLGGIVELRTSTGVVRFETVAAPVTVVDGADVQVHWPRSLRPDRPVAEVAVTVDGLPAGEVGVVRRDAREDVPRDAGADQATLTLGRALLDGVYGALRPYLLATEGTDGLR